MPGESRHVTVAGVPHTMQIVEGGVLFSNKAGFWGVSARYMFAYKSNLWYLVQVESTFGDVPLVHLDKMHKLLKAKIELSDRGPLFKR